MQRFKIQCPECEVESNFIIDNGFISGAKQCFKCEYPFVMSKLFREIKDQLQEGFNVVVLTKTAHG